MFGHNKFDGYNYSRPVSYQSYTPRVMKPYILNDASDQETDVIKNILRRSQYPIDNTETLVRGLNWNGYILGKRKFNHNSDEIANTEYYIHQWRSTNDLAHWHATGTR